LVKIHTNTNKIKTKKHNEYKNNVLDLTEAWDGLLFLSFIAYRFGGHFNTLNTHQFTKYTSTKYNKRNTHDYFTDARLLSCPTNVSHPLYLKDKSSKEEDSDV
jgi:hypothetical protein